MIQDFDSSSDTLSYSYMFKFPNGTEQEFTLRLEKNTLELIEPPDETYPDWAKLHNNKCDNCSLIEDEHTYCPVAVSISDLIEFAGDSFSYDEVEITVTTDVRTYTKKTSLQKGLSSILGLFMITSGCPVLEKLKPMARYHLPFATLSENSYRIISMYLVSQYFLHRQGKSTDWNLESLLKIYDEIHVVNKSFWKRLAHLNFKDAGLNALIMLDNSGTHIQFQIDEGYLSEIELLCDKYLT